MEQVRHPRCYDSSGRMSIGKPKEGQGKTLIGRYLRCELILMEAPDLTQLPLHPVTVDGMLEMTFRYANENLHRRLSLRAFINNIYYSDRKSSQGMAASSSEQLVDEFPTGYSFFLLQKISTIRHLASADSAAGHLSWRGTSPSEPRAVLQALPHGRPSPLRDRKWRW